MIEGQCQKRVYHAGVWSSPQCSRAAVVDGKWCKQHSPEAVKTRQEKAAKKAREQRALREREQAKRIQDRMFEPIEGWVWCELRDHLDEAHRGVIECAGHHRKLWVER